MDRVADSVPAGLPPRPVKPPDSLQQASPPPPPPALAVMEMLVTPAGIVQTKLPGWLKLHWPWAGAGVDVGAGAGGLSVEVAVGLGVASVAVALAIGLGVGDAGMRDAVVVIESLPQARSVSSRGRTRKMREKPPGMIGSHCKMGANPPRARGRLSV
jgi:hypothetical protein